MDKQFMRYYVVDFGKYNNEITSKLKECGCNIHKLINKKSKLSESIEMIKNFDVYEFNKMFKIKDNTRYYLEDYKLKISVGKGLNDLYFRKLQKEYGFKYKEI